MQPEDSGLISIERVVAFVLTPVVVALSGTLSAAAVKWGFNVSPKVIEGAFATGGLMAGAAAWKWLHGRQLYERGKVELAKVEAEVPGAAGFIHTTLHDLEGLAQSAANKAAAAVGTTAASTGPDDGGGGVEPIPPAADPAPASQVEPGVAEQADAGAASAS